MEKNSQRTPAEKNKELEAVLRTHQTRIRVVGCGGGGNNTITRLMEVGVNGVETLAINTDAQDLLASQADDKLLIGKNITKGLGAGSNPQLGEDSARESLREIEASLQNSDMVFVTCGLGGGTGTGASPIVAEVARKLGALTISIVTLPFTEEGVMRWENAQRGLEKLRQNSDTIIVIQNDRLLEVVPDLPLGMAFKTADEILVNAVKGITELITEKGLINLDFADIRTIMQNGGTAMIGLGETDGADGAQAAIEMAMQNKLLDLDITGARNALVNITGGTQMSLKDTKLVMKFVAEKLDPSARLIWGARIDQNLGKAVRVMLIVTGLQEKPVTAVKPVQGIGSDALTMQQRQPEIPSPDKEVVDQKRNQNEHALREINSEEQSESVKMGDANLSGTGRVSQKPTRKASSKSRKSTSKLEINDQTTERKPLKDKLAIREETAHDTRDGVFETIELSEQLISGSEGARDGKDKTTPSNKFEEITRSQQDVSREINVGQSSLPQFRLKQQATNGHTAAQNVRLGNEAEVTVKKIGPSFPGTGLYSKIFEEKSRANLQAIRESIGQLFTNPTRQETLLRLKTAAMMINSTAQRFVFNEIADYVATIEEICARVLDGEISMNKRLINAFTEITGILEGMIHGNADAFMEAKRHQERLQRLADASIDETMVEVASHERESQQNFRSDARVSPEPAVPMPANKAPHSHQPLRPAVEVMQYLNGLFGSNKVS
ncbi:MAG: cell division protein FtsZ [candidate division KSB1 bacterium]|nr:cell division protein FtsZ [candidate division KSB1 bacterium]MDZ7302284.1 cell division protein FtsZ [candidate division KSB1 bacterium]MDZ7311390.1 cell division protein FtsZ [candidate division KSB1 bacterium]